MINEAKAIFDFGGIDDSPTLKKKIIDAINNGKKLYPLRVSTVAEYDEVMLLLDMTDDEGYECILGRILFSSNDFNALMGDAGYIVDLGYYDKMSEDEKKEFQKEVEEDYKDPSVTHPFADKVKELEKQD